MFAGWVATNRSKFRSYIGYGELHCDSVNIVFFFVFVFFNNDRLQIVFTPDNVSLDWCASVPPLAIAFEIM